MVYHSFESQPWPLFWVLSGSRFSLGQEPKEPQDSWDSWGSRGSWARRQAGGPRLFRWLQRVRRALRRPAAAAAGLRATTSAAAPGGGTRGTGGQGTDKQTMAMEPQGVS
jgi:hypothetical protein